VEGQLEEVHADIIFFERDFLEELYLARYGKVVLTSVVGTSSETSDAIHFVDIISFYLLLP